MILQKKKKQQIVKTHLKIVKIEGYGAKKKDEMEKTQDQVTKTTLTYTYKHICE